MYLHVIRPFIKPYSVIVDPSLEVAHDIGDFVFALLQVPMDYVRSVWLTWHAGELDAASGASSGAHMNSHESVISPHSGNSTGMPTLIKPCGDMQTLFLPQAKRIAPVRSISNSNRWSNGSQPPINPTHCEASTLERHSKPIPSTTVPRYNTHLAPQDSSRYSQTLPRNSRDQMRYPPVPVYGSNTSGHSFGAEFGIIATTHGVARTVSYNPRSVREYQSDEWRSYPAFPSAYPPTPLPALASLPSPVARSKSESRYPPILESAADCHMSLEQQSELKDFKSVRGSSEQCGNLSGVHSQRDLVEPASESADDSSDIGSQSCLSDRSYMEDSDVDYDATLRTPYRSHPNGVDPSPSSSSVSLASRSTTLTSAEDTSPITRASSESMYLYNSSFSKKNGTLRPRSRNATLRGRPLGAQLYHDSFQSTAKEDSEDSADSGVGVKPQRVLISTRRTTHLRPVVRAADTSRKNAIGAKAAPARAKTMTAASRTRSSGRPASSSSSTIRRAGVTTTSRRGQQGEAKFGATKGTASYTRTGGGKAT